MFNGYDIGFSKKRFRVVVDKLLINEIGDIMGCNGLDFGFYFFL